MIIVTSPVPASEEAVDHVLNAAIPADIFHRFRRMWHLPSEFVLFVDRDFPSTRRIPLDLVGVEPTRVVTTQDRDIMEACGRVIKKGMPRVVKDPYCPEHGFLGRNCVVNGRCAFCGRPVEERDNLGYFKVRRLDDPTWRCSLWLKEEVVYSRAHVIFGYRTEKREHMILACERKWEVPLSFPRDFLRFLGLMTYPLKPTVVTESVLENYLNFYNEDLLPLLEWGERGERVSGYYRMEGVVEAYRTFNIKKLREEIVRAVKTGERLSGRVKTGYAGALALLLWPIIPETSGEVLDSLGLEPDVESWRPAKKVRKVYLTRVGVQREPLPERRINPGIIKVGRVKHQQETSFGYVLVTESGVRLEYRGDRNLKGRVVAYLPVKSYEVDGIVITGRLLTAGDAAIVSEGEGEVKAL